MSAPLVINLRDGSVWERRGVTPEGVALYALAGSCKCPEYLLATEAELAAQGIAGSADVLPVPVGPERRTLDKVEDELTGANLSLYEEELTSARLRLALASAQRGRRELRGDLRFVEGSRQRWRTACIEAERERDQLKARVAELEAERHETNKALDDAVQELREKEKREAVVAEFVAARAGYIVAIRNCHSDNGHDYDRWQGHAAARRQLADLLGLPVAWPSEDSAAVEESADKLTALLAPSQVLREDAAAEAGDPR